MSELEPLQAALAFLRGDLAEKVASRDKFVHESKTLRVDPTICETLDRTLDFLSSQIKASEAAIARLEYTCAQLATPPAPQSEIVPRIDPTKYSYSIFVHGPSFSSNVKGIQLKDKSQLRTCAMAIVANMPCFVEDELPHEEKDLRHLSISMDILAMDGSNTVSEVHFKLPSLFELHRQIDLLLKGIPIYSVEILDEHANYLMEDTSITSDKVLPFVVRALTILTSLKGGETPVRVFITKAKDRHSTDESLHVNLFTSDHQQIIQVVHSYLNNTI